MNAGEHQDPRTVELEAELAETAAALAAAVQRLRDLEAALAASYQVQAALADPKFAETLEVERLSQVTNLRARIVDLRSRNQALKAQNLRLTRQLTDLRSSRTFRWTAGLRAVLGRRPGPKI